MVQLSQLRLKLFSPAQCFKSQRKYTNPKTTNQSGLKIQGQFNLVLSGYSTTLNLGWGTRL